MQANIQVGVNIARYRNLLTDAEVAYHEAPASSESVTCLTYAGVPDEKALNDYVRALNSWASCLAKALTSNCLTTGSVADRFEQRQWNDATIQLAKAANALG